MTFADGEKGEVEDMDVCVYEMHPAQWATLHNTTPIFLGRCGSLIVHACVCVGMKARNEAVNCHLY